MYWQESHPSGGPHVLQDRFLSLSYVCYNRNTCCRGWCWMYNPRSKGRWSASVPRDHFSRFEKQNSKGNSLAASSLIAQPLPEILKWTILHKHSLHHDINLGEVNTNGHSYHSHQTYGHSSLVQFHGSLITRGWGSLVIQVDYFCVSKVCTGLSL